jgi:hypothetical protein
MGPRKISPCLNRCLVVRGFDDVRRPVLCFREATVAVSAADLRRREVCAYCGSDFFDRHVGRGFKMRALPAAMEQHLR